ncbi:unnamed protein product [Caenorhabditis brenneri]
MEKLTRTKLTKSPAMKFNFASTDKDGSSCSPFLFVTAMSWIKYAPSGNYVNNFYGESIAAWVAIIYMLCKTPFGLFAVCAGRE